MLLSKLEETLVIGNRRFELSCNLYPGAVHPEGFQYLASFKTEPFTCFVYQVEGIEIEKRVLMIHGENTTVALPGVSRALLRVYERNGTATVIRAWLMELAIVPTEIPR